jgi:hypothetical protein
MEVKHDFVFQVDHPIVKDAYEQMQHISIQYNAKGEQDLCAIYFSSHYIYNPNEEGVFRSEIVEKNRFEWFGTRINRAGKHIFLRDIHKQWYLTGVNATLNTPELLTQYLKRETEGYRTITLGSSAGGFAAIFYGQQLDSEIILSFNGQFEVNSQLKTSGPDIDPVIFRNQANPELSRYFDIAGLIRKPRTIHYFYSIHSAWDAQQAGHVKDLYINRTGFNTSHHGIPFLKNNLPRVINLDQEELNRLNGKIFHPIRFSILQMGLLDTLAGLKSIALTIVKHKLKRH